MTDLDTELRDRLGAAADRMPAIDPARLADRVDQKMASQQRRSTVLRATAAVAAIVMAAGAAVAVTSQNDDQADTTVAAAPTTTSVAAAIERAPGWSTSSPSPLSPRFEHLSVAIGDEVLVWGGTVVDFDGQQVESTALGDGAIYDVTTDTWREIPDGPLFGGTAQGVWTGTVALVVASTDGHGTGARQAAAFDPTTDTWTTLADPPAGTVAGAVTEAVWTGDRMMVVNGDSALGARLDIYDPATDEWATASLPATPLPSISTSVWTGAELVVVGYDQGVGDQAYTVNGDLDGDGDDMDPGDPPPIPESPTKGQSLIHVYSPATDSWRQIPWQLEGGHREAVTAAWTGTALFVGGGSSVASGSSPARDDVGGEAALVDVATGEWTPLPDAPRPFSATRGRSFVVTGDALISIDHVSTIIFDLATSTWNEQAPAPGPERYSSALDLAGGHVVITMGGTSTEDPGGGCCSTGPTDAVVFTP